MSTTFSAGVTEAVSASSTLADSLTVDVVDLVAEFNNPISVARTEWYRLFDQDPRATIFQHPEYTACELSQLARTKLPCLMLLAKRDGQLVGLGALLPKVSSSKHVGGVGPGWKIIGYRLVGNGFLGSSDSEVERTLLNSAMAEVRRHGARFLLIEDLDQTSTLLRQAEALVPNGYQIYSPTSMQVRLKIQLPPTADEYWSKFGAKTRNTFRRLERKLGDFRVVCFQSLDQVPDFLRDANKISVNTWQTDQFGLRIKNDDNELAQHTFLAQHGALRSYILYFGDTPVTFVVGMQFRGVFRYDEVGFDRQYHALSPGRVLLIKILEDVYARQTAQWFDFGMGDADYKRIFSNQEGTAGNVWILPPGLKSKSLIGYLNGSRIARNLGKQAVKALGWYRRMRQKSRLGAAIDVNATGHVNDAAISAPVVSPANRSLAQKVTQSVDSSVTHDNLQPGVLPEKKQKNKKKQPDSERSPVAPSEEGSQARGQASAIETVTESQSDTSGLTI